MIIKCEISLARRPLDAQGVAHQLLTLVALAQFRALLLVFAVQLRTNTTHDAARYSLVHCTLAQKKYVREKLHRMFLNIEFLLRNPNIEITKKYDILHFEVLN